MERSNETASRVRVRRVRTASDRKAFVELPLRLYQDCPYFVPPLYRDELKLLAGGGNNENAEAVFFLAEKEGKIVGRIQGIIQYQHNIKNDCTQMRFTRFDCIDDTQVAAALFSAAQQWGCERGMTEICGPLGYNDLDREGLLIDGFEELSTFEEQYNFPYYPKLLEAAGFQKDVDWLEYELRKPLKENEMLSRVAKRALEINKLHIASTDLPKRQYIEKYRDGFFDCLDECYSKLYGTVPISKNAQDELVEQFMMIVNKEFAFFICDENERVVAFGLCFPAIGEAVQKSGGRMTPATLLRLLKAVKHPSVIDLGLVAVRPEYRNSGVNAVIINGLIQMLSSGKVKKCETNLCLETNKAVQAQWKYFNARQHKRRRSYIKKIEENKNA